MPEVQILGKEVDVSFRNKALVFAAVGVGVVLFISRRKSADMPTETSGAASSEGVGGGNAAASLEFATLAAQSQTELANLTAANRLEEKRITSDQDYRLKSLEVEREISLAQINLNDPTRSKQCVPWTQWNAMSKGQRDLINSQVRQGKVILQPSLSGMCIQPTQIGLRGSEPPVKSSTKRGLLSSKSSTSGPAGSFTPEQREAPGTVLGDLTQEVIKGYFSSYPGFNQ
jgi:hypothetical protein